MITTQRITREYLLQKGMCAQEHISDVFGVVTPREKLQPYRWKKQRYGFEKQTLDIVFTAFRYSAKGEDKGYDVFVETAKLLHRQYADVRFHVVGGFDASVLDVSELGETITFYGCRPSDWFDTFYQDKDLILAPNAVGRVGAGSFDGFPTASCTEAALCGTAILCTDPLELNDGHFDAQSEICILPRDAGVIAQRIAQLRENPAALAALGEAGSRAVRRMYGIDRQMGPRISLLKEMLAYASQLSGTVRQANQLQPMRPIRWRVFYQTEETPEYSDDRRVDGSALFLKDEEVYLEFYLPENFCFPELRLSFYSDTCCFCVPLHAECGNMPLEVFAANGVWMDGEYCFAEGEKQLFFRAADGTSLSDRRVQILLRARWRPADEIGMITGRIMQKFESSAAQMLELQEQWEAGKRDLLSRNEALQDQNSCLQERNKALEEENKTQEETNKLLEQENENLEGQRVCLETEVSRLREKVDGYEKMLAIRLYHKLNQMRYGSDRGPHVTNPPKED